MVLTTRPLGPEDAHSWRKLREEGVNLFPMAFLTGAEEVRAETDAAVAKRLARGQSHGVFEDAALVGIATLARKSDARAAHRAEVSGFYVTPEAQGKGAADALMTALCEVAHLKGIWQLELDVSAQNPRAIRFYERHGFRREGRIPNAIIAETGPEDDWFYIRQLAD